jgi:hypothetical protein
MAVFFKLTHFTEILDGYTGDSSNRRVRGTSYECCQLKTNHVYNPSTGTNSCKFPTELMQSPYQDLTAPNPEVGKFLVFIFFISLK